MCASGTPRRKTTVNSFRFVISPQARERLFLWWKYFRQEIQQKLGNSNFGNSNKIPKQKAERSTSLQLLGNKTTVKIDGFLKWRAHTIWATSLKQRFPLTLGQGRQKFSTSPSLKSTSRCLESLPPDHIFAGD